MFTPIQIDIPNFLPNHPWHPSVVYIEDGWNGHQWWLAQTPFSPNNVPPPLIKIGGSYLVFIIPMMEYIGNLLMQILLMIFLKN